MKNLRDAAYSSIIWVRDIPIGYMINGRARLRPEEDVDMNIERRYNGTSGEVRAEYRRVRKSFEELV